MMRVLSIARGAKDAASSDHIAPGPFDVRLSVRSLTSKKLQIVLILRSLAASDDYHMIVDNDLPGLSGLELVLRARSLSHRRHTPIIMLSSDDCEKEAWRAGVDAFLLKPKGVDKVSSTIDRLLKDRNKKRN